MTDVRSSSWETPATEPLDDLGQFLARVRERASRAPAIDLVGLARQLGYPVQVVRPGGSLLQRLLVERQERCHRIAVVTPYSPREVAEALDGARRLGQTDDWTERALMEIAPTGLPASALVDFLRGESHAREFEAFLRLPAARGRGLERGVRAAEATLCRRQRRARGAQARRAGAARSAGTGTSAPQGSKGGAVMLKVTLTGKTLPFTPSCAAKPSRSNTGESVCSQPYAPRVGKLSAALALTLVGCAVGDVESPRPRTDGMACYEAFDAAAEGWEMFVGPLPPQCQHLDEVYRIVVTDGPMPCMGSDPGRVVGCHLANVNERGERAVGERVIYIAADLSDTGRVDQSVHEWMHALSYCVRWDAPGYQTDLVDGANDHADVRVWGTNPHDKSIRLDPDSAQSYGVLVSAIGPCVE